MGEGVRGVCDVGEGVRGVCDMGEGVRGVCDMGEGVRDICDMGEGVMLLPPSPCSLHASQQQHIALQKQLRVMENRMEKVLLLIDCDDCTKTSGHHKMPLFVYSIH